MYVFRCRVIRLDDSDCIRAVSSLIAESAVSGLGESLNILYGDIVVDENFEFT
jgi:hypothetical protein